MAENAPDRKNPFMPNVGKKAPYLAGREHEIGIWRQHLSGLLPMDDAGQPQQPSGSIVLMYGPRGMGKTALLMELESMAAQSGGIGVVRRQGDSFNGGSDRLADDLLSEVGSPAWRVTSAKVEGKVSAAVVKGGGSVNAEVDDPTKGGGLTYRLRQQCMEGPVVVLVDEVHAIEGKKGLQALGALVNTGQQLVTDHPFLLVLAGTPGMLKTLHDANCSFIARQDEDDVALGIDRLGEEAAEDAICRPLAEGPWRLPNGKRLSIAPHALAKALKDSQGFPHFLQQWGKQLWNQAVRSGKHHLGPEDADAVMEAVAARRAKFYAEQGAELQDGFMPKAAIAVADAFRDAAGKGEPVTESAARTAINEALESVVPEEGKRVTMAESSLKELKRLGYCWLPPRSGHLIAGIPSFMDYARGVCPPLEKPPPTVIDRKTGQAFTLGDLVGMDSDDPRCILTPAGEAPAGGPIEVSAASLTAIYKGVDGKGQALLEKRQAKAREALGTEGPPGPDMDAPAPGR